MFKAVTGLTPRAYAAAHRRARVSRELERAATVTRAIYDAGYNSNGRFYGESRRLLGMSPASYRTGGAGAEIRFAVGESCLGSILVARSPMGVCAILLGDDADAALGKRIGALASAFDFDGVRQLASELTALDRRDGR